MQFKKEEILSENKVKISGSYVGEGRFGNWNSRESRDVTIV